MIRLTYIFCSIIIALSSNIHAIDLDDEHYGVLEEFVHSQEIDNLRTSLLGDFTSQEIKKILEVERPNREQIKTLEKLQRKKDQHDNTLLHACAIKAHRFLILKYLAYGGKLIDSWDTANKFGLTQLGMLIVSGNLDRF